MKRLLVILSIVAGIAVFATDCPRCRKHTYWFWKCQNCGTVYCDCCSTRSNQDIVENRNDTTSCSSTQCPVCHQNTGKEIQMN